MLSPILSSEFQTTNDRTLLVYEDTVKCFDLSFCERHSPHG